MGQNRFFGGRLFVLAVLALVSLSGCSQQQAKSTSKPVLPGATGAVKDTQLPTPEQAVRTLGNISGAVYDRKTEQLVLLGSGPADSGAYLHLEDLAVALKSLELDSREPRFSLDPANARDPYGPNLRLVYSAPIGSTHFGQVMFDADWLLKCYSFGRIRKADGSDGEGQVVSSAVPGYKNLSDMAFERPVADEMWTRLWITADEGFFDRNNDTLILSKLRMKVNTEEMYRTEKGLEPFNGRKNPDAVRFAAHFTEYYDRFGQEQPAFLEVKELAKAVVLAKWIKQRKVVIDPEWVDEFSRGRNDLPTTVKALEISQERITQVPRGYERRTFRLTGGVDLAVKPVYSPSKALAALEAGIRNILDRPGAGPIFVLEHKGKRYPAMVAPVNTPGKLAWKKGGA